MKSPYCIDCSSGSIAVHWGGGGRCQKCSDKFKAQIHEMQKRTWGAERAALKSHIDRSRAEGECPDDGVLCESCCDHEELDHGICSDCGKDLSDDLAARAEFAAECARGR